MATVIHRHIPMEIRSTHALVKQLTGTIKWRVIEAVRHYSKHEPDNRIRFKKGSGYANVRWYREHWDSLFCYRIDGTNEVLFLQYHSDAVWIYRGLYEVQTDLFGDNAVICHDVLRFTVPVFSKFSVDSRKQLAENEGVG